MPCGRPLQRSIGASNERDQRLFGHILRCRAVDAGAVLDAFQKLSVLGDGSVLMP